MIGHPRPGSFVFGLKSILYNYSFFYISEHIRNTAIEIKTSPLRKIGKNGFLQCTALSKRPDVIVHMNDTYIINVDGKLESVVR